MRRVHPTFAGYICPIQTVDGEGVGLNKQIAVSASITHGSSSLLLKVRFCQILEFIPLSKVTPLLLSTGVAPVKVNGHWIGCVEKAYHFVDKYRFLRRQLKINQYTGIHWDSVVNEVNFWVDKGRLVRPLLIVYNNYGDHYTSKHVRQLNTSDDKKNKSQKFSKEEDFRQWVAITNDHIKNSKQERSQ